MPTKPTPAICETVNAVFDAVKRDGIAKIKSMFPNIVTDDAVDCLERTIELARTLSLEGHSPSHVLLIPSALLRSIFGAMPSSQ